MTVQELNLHLKKFLCIAQDMMLDFDTVMENTLTMPDLFQLYEAAGSMMLRIVGITLCSYAV